MNKMNYLNVGCGNKIHEAWFNLDMATENPHVSSCNLLKGIPFPDDHFEVLYHSQVLEHFPKDKAPFFIKECWRVLKPGGIMRVVVPDLENIVNEYIKCLNENIRNPSSQSEANYDWILLEMYDQAVRNDSGGQMAEFLSQPDLINENYIIDRSGYTGRSMRDILINKNGGQSLSYLSKVVEKVKRIGIRRFFKQVFDRLSALFSSEERRIGAFRLGGEIHMWMYDRFSLSRLLRGAGFEDIEIKTPYESSIPEWDKYELDVKDGVAFDPASLFVEARKPR